MNNQAPQYLSNLLVDHLYNRSGLQSNDMYQRLIIPFTKDKLLPTEASVLWALHCEMNCPNFSKKSSTLDMLKKDLKTFIFIHECADLRIEQLQGS